jgi:CheY-like chemotaxis protein
MAEQKLILIVDDEPAFREIFSVKLAADGFRVETAENGQIGIEKAKALKPGLILMDVRMPVMDGATALLQLREDPETKNAKVIFLSSIGDAHQEMEEMHRRISKEFGAQGYFRKTDNIDRLGDEIKKLLA